MVTTKRVEDRMNESEALIWRGERHSPRSLTSSVLMMLDTVPDWDRLRAVHERAAGLVPRLRARVLEPAVPVGPPAWVPDPAFDLDYHLRRVSLPAPGEMAQLLRFAQGAAMTPIDRTRPLWEATLVEGLPDGKAAYLLKLHHSLTDDLHGARLAPLSGSRHRDHTGHRPDAPQQLPAPPPDARWLAVDELAEQLVALPSVTGKLLSAGARVLAHPEAATASTLRFASSLRRTAAPQSVPGSPLFRGRTGKSWRFGVMECPRGRLDAAAETAGGSIDDAYIAAILGGIRRYHERHGADLSHLSMTMPVALTGSVNPADGTGWAGATFAAPVGVRDPEERIATVRGIMLSLRVEPALHSLALLAPVLNRVPSAVRTAIGRLSGPADVAASHVPGDPGKAYLAGAKVERTYPFGPLSGTALTAAMVTQAGTCCIGISIDGAAVPDPEVLVTCLREGLAEVLAPARGTGSPPQCVSGTARRARPSPAASRAQP